MVLSRLRYRLQPSSDCRLAESLRAKERFSFKAGQLLKHTLGLTSAFGKKRFVLLYLWYDVKGSDAARQHRVEVQEFGNLLGNEVLFRTDTYQNASLSGCPQ